MGKRKDTSSGNDGRYVKVNIVEIAKNEQPFLATFPGTKPTEDMKFTQYRSSDANASIKKANQAVVVGETDKVSFAGANFGDEAVPNTYCKYLVGIYSKKNNSLEVTNAPIIRMTREVKALANKSQDPNTIARGQVARAALGLAFGTAKAKQQLKSDERNLVTGEHLVNEMDNLHTEIDRATVNIPKQEKLRDAIKSDLPVPKFDIEASSPDEVYDVTSIVTDEELNTMNAKDLLKETSLQGIKTHLAYHDSKFTNTRLMAILASPGKKDRVRVRTLMYINLLMGYYIRVRNSDLGNRRKVEAALKSPSSVVLDGLAERYTEGNRRTPIMDDKILLYMFALVLRVSNYSIVLDELAKDLLLKPSKIAQLFRSLGCKVDKANAEEIREAGNKMAKKATLVVPLKFPDVRNANRK
ncbi:RNA polymerase I associated factor, A49-like protein [Backusella circina FSU 941]|nr:RNA polymerase I associated factor, A49-like protein [Backusella circina FSU 941]